MQPGIDWLAAHTGKPVLGVLPYLPGLFLDAEDAVARQSVSVGAAALRVVAPAYPRVANHNDLDPLRLHPQVDLRWIGAGETPPPADLLILPGSKSVIADLAWLRAQGWEPYLQSHLRYGGRLIGLCGGFQMLGRVLHDPAGREGPAASVAGFGWLDMETTLEAEKRLVNVQGALNLPGAPAIRGYEIHQGISRGPALAHPALQLDGRDEGALSADGRLLGTYCHGLFDHPEGQRALLDWAGAPALAPVDFAARREADLDRLADATEMALDWPRLEQWL